MSHRSLRALFNRCIYSIEIFKHRSRSRRALLRLNADQLKDIGLTAEQALIEGQKPFWKGESTINGKSFFQHTMTFKQAPPNFRLKA